MSIIIYYDFWSVRYPHQQSVTHHRIPSAANKQNQEPHIVVSHHSSSHQLPTDTGKTNIHTIIQ